MQITPAEVAETLAMVSKQNLDIRTITLGINLRGCVDADVVEDGDCPQDVLLVCRQSFQAADGVGVGVDLEEMVDAPGVAVIKGDGFLYYLFNRCHGNPCLSFSLYYRGGRIGTG